MKLKSALAVLLAGILTCGMFAACKKSDAGNNSNPDSGSKAEEYVSGKLSAAHDAVKELFGEEYTPSMEVDETMLSETYGVSKEMVKEVIAEVPMISVHVDTFIGIEAAEGQADAVEKALTAYRDRLAEDEMQYPMNREKTRASQVVRYGDYVFFLMLSGNPDEVLEKDESEQFAFYQEENQRAADAVKKALSA